MAQVTLIDTVEIGKHKHTDSRNSPHRTHPACHEKHDERPSYACYQQTSQGISRHKSVAKRLNSRIYRWVAEGELSCCAIVIALLYK